MADSPQPEAVALAGAEAVHMLIAERDAATKSARDWEARARQQLGRADTLDEQLHQTKAKLDYYMNYSTSLVTKLHHVSMTVADAMKESRESALDGRRTMPASLLDDVGVTAVSAALEPPKNENGPQRSMSDILDAASNPHHQGPPPEFLTATGVRAGAQQTEGQEKTS